MSWGLLSGLGRGLNNAAVTLNAGMAEDRRARIEAMREANAEKWRQKAFETGRADRAEDINRQSQWRSEDMEARRQAEERAQRNADRQFNQSSGQFDRKMGAQEKRVIEQNLSAIMEQEARAAERIRADYSKRMQDMGANPEQLQAEMQQVLEENQMFYSQRLHNMIMSYGDQMRGTGFEYLLNMSQAAQQSEPDYSDVDQSYDPAIDNLVSGIMASEADPVAGRSGTPANNSPRPFTFLPAFQAGRADARSGIDGGNKHGADLSLKHTSRAQYPLGLLGYAAGGVSGAIEAPFVGARNWLFESPEQREQRLKQQQGR